MPKSIQSPGGLSVIQAEGELRAMPQRAILPWWWPLCGWFQWRLVQDKKQHGTTFLCESRHTIPTNQSPIYCFTLKF